MFLSLFQRLVCREISVLRQLGDVKRAAELRPDSRAFAPA
jgi:hypothetical protein